MGKIIDSFREFEKRTGQVVIEHGEETLKIAKELSDLVAALPLSKADNDKLVHLMKDQLLTAEHEQFLKGAELGLKVAAIFNEDKRSK